MLDPSAKTHTNMRERESERERERESMDLPSTKGVWGFVRHICLANNIREKKGVN